MTLWEEDMFDEDRDHYCSYCGLEMTLDEYIEHDFELCIYGCDYEGEDDE